MAKSIEEAAMETWRSEQYAAASAIREAIDALGRAGRAALELARCRDVRRTRDDLSGLTGQATRAMAAADGCLLGARSLLADAQECLSIEMGEQPTAPNPDDGPGF